MDATAHYKQPYIQRMPGKRMGHPPGMIPKTVKPMTAFDSLKGFTRDNAPGFTVDSENLQKLGMTTRFQSNEQPVNPIGMIEQYIREPYYSSPHPKFSGQGMPTTKVGITSFFNKVKGIYQLNLKNAKLFWESWADGESVEYLELLIPAVVSQQRAHASNIGPSTTVKFSRRISDPGVAREEFGEMTESEQLAFANAKNTFKNTTFGRITDTDKTNSRFV